MIVWFCHAKVGHCQAPNQSPRRKSRAFCFCNDLSCGGVARLATLSMLAAPTRRNPPMRRTAFAILVSCLLCACQNGTVTLSVADPPIDGASQVKVRFDSVDLVESDGSKHSFDLDPDQTVNLLSSTSTQLLN